MKYPNHILLDLKVRTPSNFSTSWKNSYEVDLNIKTFKNPTHNLTINSLNTLTKSSSNTFNKNKTRVAATSSLLPIFDVHFLRKEKLYTKLKYSRCPQYDIVSGGFAAILAGFIGFLISEKFGIELVDSGDFYIAFMYGVFAAFSLRPLILSYSKHETPYNPLSLKYLFLFFSDLFLLFTTSLKKYFIWILKLWA